MGGLPQFVGQNQMENVDLETAENLVRLFDREGSFSFQYVMKVWLRDSRLAGEAAFGGFAAAHAEAKLFNQALLQILKCHGFRPNGLFLPEIGHQETSLELLV